MTVKEKIRFLIIRSIGNFLVLFAIFGVLATFGPALYYEVQYRIIQIRGVRFAVVEEMRDARPPSSSLEGEVGRERGELRNKRNRSANGFAQVLTGPKEQVLTPIDSVFSILIPKIGASARIFPNIDPSNSNAFLPVLRYGVAHAKGTVFPGQAGNIYLFAHSTDNFWDVGRYNAIFYLLKDLTPGDDVVIFSQNVRHNYKVTKLGIINSEEVSFITRAQTGKELLILQTCWPPGTTWQRLIVFAQPK